MADVYTRIGYIKGATGAQGAQGLQGDPGEAATIEVGSVTTVPYGQTANVTNSGTESAAIFDFQIPQGRPGEQVTDMQNLTIGAITTSSASFPVPAVGETGKVLWGKVVKWFSDMSALVATKLNVANVVNNLTTTDSGYALDARQGKALNDAMTNLHNHTVTKSHSGINNSSTGLFCETVGKVYMFGGYMYVTADIPVSSVLATVDIRPFRNGYASVITNQSNSGRLLLQTDGKFISDSILKANNWYSFTITGITQ